MTTLTQPDLLYPDSDGNPMADNTKQFRWITTYKGGIDALFADRVGVFVAGDLLWYPIKGKPTVRVAPDVLVVFGRPKGDRGSYKQWEEGEIAPQVVFEILSPGNTLVEMINKHAFYQRHGVEEYYLHDPDRNEIFGWLRDPETGDLAQIAQMNGFTSPRLGIRWDTSGEEISVFGSDNRAFVDYTTLAQERNRLAQKLRELGIDPETV